MAGQRSGGKDALRALRYCGECHVNQQSELKYLGHVRLLQFAQQIKDMNGDYDQVPADIF